MIGHIDSDHFGRRVGDVLVVCCCFYFSLKGKGKRLCRICSRVVEKGGIGIEKWDYRSFETSNGFGIGLLIDLLRDTTDRPLAISVLSLGRRPSFRRQADIFVNTNFVVKQSVR